MTFPGRFGISCECGRRLASTVPSDMLKARGVEAVFKCSPCNLEMHTLSKEATERYKARRAKRRTPQ